MKRNSIIKTIFILFCVLFSYIYFSNSENVRWFNRPNTCPYHHHSLKSIPILYGLPIMDSLLWKAVDEKEIILGGCVIDENSPMEKIICKECGFELSIMGNQTYWWRLSEDLRSFIIPLKSSITNFPLLDLDTTRRYEYPVYSQALKSDTLYRESIKYVSLKNESHFYNIFYDYAKILGLNLIQVNTDSISKFYNPGSDCFIAETDSMLFQFEVSKYYPDSTSFVSFSWSLNE